MTKHRIKQTLLCHFAPQKRCVCTNKTLRFSWEHQFREYKSVCRDLKDLLWQGWPNKYHQVRVVPTLPDHQGLGSVFDHFLTTIKKNQNQHFSSIRYFVQEIEQWIQRPVGHYQESRKLNDLILWLYNLDTNIKKMSKQSQLYVKLDVSNVPVIKPPFKPYNSASTNLFVTIKIVVVFPIPSIATRTHLRLMDVSNMIRQGLIL